MNEHKITEEQQLLQQAFQARAKAFLDSYNAALTGILANNNTHPTTIEIVNKAFEIAHYAAKNIDKQFQKIIEDISNEFREANSSIVRP